VSDKPIAGLVIAAVVAPLCVLCVLGPVILASGVAGAWGWLSGLGPAVILGLVLLVAALACGLLRWRKLRTSRHGPAADGPVPATRKETL
jgi:protein-S-isoprenylcysteine O-methyltransferase Ste14